MFVAGGVAKSLKLELGRALRFVSTRGATMDTLQACRARGLEHFYLVVPKTTQWEYGGLNGAAQSDEVRQIGFREHYCGVCRLPEAVAIRISPKSTSRF
jgi:hypothetical protein